MGFEGLVAVPSLTKDDFVRFLLSPTYPSDFNIYSRSRTGTQVDVFYVPSKKRLHRSIGLDQLSIGSDGKTGSLPFSPPHLEATH